MPQAMAANSSTPDSSAADSSPAVTPETGAPAAAPPGPPTGPDTSGFSRLQDKALQFAPNEVHAPDYSLSRLDRERLPLPHDGWQGFDSAEATHAHHGLELPKAEAQAQEPKPGQPQLPRRKEGGRPERPDGR